MKLFNGQIMAKIAETASNALERDGSKQFSSCRLRLLGEPEIPIELIIDELDN